MIQPKSLYCVALVPLAWWWRDNDGLKDLARGGEFTRASTGCNAADPYAPLENVPHSRRRGFSCYLKGFLPLIRRLSFAECLHFLLRNTGVLFSPGSLGSETPSTSFA
jgi:hypothetical protein